MSAARTIGALQLGASPEGPGATVERVLAHEQRLAGCDLVVLPEALLGGYPKGADFGARVGYRTDEGRDAFRAYWDHAVELDGPEVAALAALAGRCEAALVAGVVERGGSTLYCTALFFSAAGELAASHRKVMPTASERLIWGQGDGSTLPVVQTPAGRAGAAICWENYMPLLRAAMYAQGLDVWCAPTVDDRDVWQSSMRHIAYEGRLFLVSACQYLPPPVDGRAGDRPWPGDQPLIRGGSVIFSPMGEPLAGPLYGEEGLITATVDPDDIVRARYDLDPVGHYSRPDIFRLEVDRQARPAATWAPGEAEPTPPRHVLTILAVADLQRSRRFYQDTFGWPARVEVPVYVELALPDGRGLGLYRRENFAHNTGQEPQALPEGAIAGTEVYLHCDDLHAAVARAQRAGGRLLSAAAPREWGDDAAYLADPDGNVVVLATPSR